jgi:hypothetical protein
VFNSAANFNQQQKNVPRACRVCAASFYRFLEISLRHPDSA